MNFDLNPRMDLDLNLDLDLDLSMDVDLSIDLSMDLSMDPNMDLFFDPAMETIDVELGVDVADAFDVPSPRKADAWPAYDDDEKQLPVDDDASSTDSSSTDERQTQRGRWTQDEHDRFLTGYKLYGRSWKLIATHVVPTRSYTQVRTHAQKYLLSRQSSSKDARSLPSSPLLLSPPAHGRVSSIAA